MKTYPALKSSLAALATVSAMLMSGMAAASGLYVDIQKSVAFSGDYNPAPIGVTADYDSQWKASAPTAWFGTIMATSPGTVTATYLGQESGYVNSYSLEFFTNMLLETDAVGRTVSANVSSAVTPFALDFSFNTKSGSGYQEKVGNGQVFSVMSPSFAILGDYLKSQTATINGVSKTFDYILGFNDSWTGDADFDDFVVGINYAPTPVPLPAAAWLFGSALLGFIAVSNRRKV
jgi:hypothetical protein